jgi:uncharacterized protein YjeT (DUF2065 family)
MVLRRIVAVLALLIILVGLMEIIFPEWALIATESLVGLVLLRLMGVLGLAIGVVLVVAAAKRLVGLRLFVLIAGLYVIVAGLVVFVSPPLIRDLIDAIFLNRSPAFQLTMLWATGLLRIGIGAALLYAFAKPPRPDANAG